MKRIYIFYINFIYLGRELTAEEGMKNELARII